MARKKKVPVVKLAERDEAAAVAAGLPAEVNLALADVAGAVRDGLLAFSCSAGMLVIGQIMAEEMAAKVGRRAVTIPTGWPPATGLRRARWPSAGARCQSSGPGRR